MFSLITDPLLSLLYPHSCRSCGRAAENASYGAACRDCWLSTKIFNDRDPLCIKCGVPLAGVGQQASSSCRRCDLHHYDKAWAGGLYEKALAASVLGLKDTPNVPGTARKLLIDAFEQLSMPAEFTIVPVPLSKQRLIERGFNQASLLARVISKHSGRPVDEYSLVRKQDTPMHRAAMDRKARDATVKNAFAVVRPSLIQGRDILLVDDVMTSGATVSYCAKALKKKGAGKVFVLTLARAAL